MITLRDKGIYNVFYPEGSICIVFIQGRSGQNYFGCFDNFDTFYNKIFSNTGIWNWERREFKKMYVNLNSLRHYCFNRAPNSLIYTYQKNENSEVLDPDADPKFKIKPTIARNDDIKSIDWMVFDFDSVKPPEFKNDPSTNDEQHGTQVHREKTKELMKKRYGLKDPVEAMSANGCYLMYKLPGWNTNKMELIKKLLKSLSIDKKLINKHSLLDSNVRLSQNMNLWGTVARKGRESKDRPYRISYIETLGSLEPVPDDFLEALEKDFPKKPRKYYPPEDALDVEVFCYEHGVDIREIKVQGEATIFILEECPFHGRDESGNAVVLIQSPGFMNPLFRCEHNRCRDMKWVHFKEAVGGY